MGMLLVDLDIVSCYTSILLGLYPERLGTIQYAIETKGEANDQRACGLRRSLKRTVEATFITSQPLRYVCIQASLSVATEL